MVYSFDVFDTLITRTTATPTGIFAIMQKVIKRNEIYEDLPPLVREKFYQVRVDSEREARATNQIKGKTAEVTLAQIYKIMRLMHGLTDKQEDLLKQLELETEYENIVPIQHNIEKLKEYKKRYLVFLISDMYLSESIIRKMLLKIDKIFEDIPIMVSCDYEKTKASGQLYDVFLAQNGIKPEEWIHVGDNKISDGIQVEIKGGKAQLVDLYPYTDFETVTISNNIDNADFQLALGAVKNSNPKESEFYEIGRRFGGVILYSYILWVLETAKKLDIGDLYFIARDGYVLKAIADVIVQEKGWGIRTHYLYGSRKAWQLPSLGDSKDDLRNWFAAKCNPYSIEELCQMLFIDKKTLIEFLPDIVTLDFEVNILTYEEVAFIRQLLLANDDFFDLLQTIISGKKREAEAYLQQEINRKERYAFVEVNGSGYTQQCLYHLINNPEQKIVSFFYTLAGINDFYKEHNVYYKYTFERFEIAEVIELFCRSFHGQTAGYTCIDNVWKPVLEEEIKDYVSEKECQIYVDGLLDFVKNLCVNNVADGIGLNSVANAYIRHICNEPEEEVLRFIGDMPFIARSVQDDSKNDSSDSCQSFAPHLSEEEIKRIYLYGDIVWYERKYSPTGRKCIQYRLTERDRELIEFYSNIRKQLRVPAFKKTEKTAVKMQGRVALYGAGIRGKRIYNTLIGAGEVEVVAWVDRNYEKCKAAGMSISSPENLRDLEFDLLIIAVANKDTVNEIKQYLKSMGISEDKIY